MDFWNRLIPPGARPDPPEPLTGDHIDAGYRLYWVKTALAWDADRRARIAARVAAVIESAEFERTDLERRFTVEGLDASAHSGASLLALAEALRALETFDEG